MLLMMPQSTTLKTKKRLSSPSLFQGTIWVPVILMFFMLAGLGKFIAYSGGFGVVRAAIPVFHQAFEDKSESRFEQRYSAEITNHTVAIVVTTEAIFFGAVKAFTSEIGDFRNKFSVKHVDGSPQLKTALGKLQKWINSRELQKRPIDTNVGILVPDGKVPVPVLMQLVQGINEAKIFENTVISTGLM